MTLPVKYSGKDGYRGKLLSHKVDILCQYEGFIPGIRINGRLLCKLDHILRRINIYDCIIAYGFLTDRQPVKGNILKRRLMPFIAE